MHHVPLHNSNEKNLTCATITMPLFIHNKRGTQRAAPEEMRFKTTAATTGSHGANVIVCCEPLQTKAVATRTAWSFIVDRLTIQER